MLDYDNPRSLGSRFRRARSKIVYDLIDRHRRDGEPFRILDLGGSIHYWRLMDETFLRSRGCQIHIVNLEDHVVSDGLLSASTGDGRNLAAYGDNHFDLVHSNSVLEHVGGWQDMLAFAQEIRRLAPHYYVQTPAFSFPIEPHYGFPFVHWLPRQLRASLLRHVALGRFGPVRTMGEAMHIVEDSDLLSAGQFAALFPDAAMKPERFLGLTKSFIAVR